MSIKILNTDCSGLYVGNQEAYKAYLGSTLVYSKELPNVSYLCNYNAKNFNAATQTFVKTTGQTFAYDLTNNAGNTGYTYSVSGGCVTLDGRYAFSNTFADANSNPFNVAAGDSQITIIYKAGFDTALDYMFENTDNLYLYKDAIRTTNNYQLTVNVPANTPATVVLRIDSSGNGERKYIEGGVSTTAALTLASAGDTVKFFKDFSGDFYWFFASREYLTDAQVAEVIAYNG